MRVSGLLEHCSCLKCGIHKFVNGIRQPVMRIPEFQIQWYFLKCDIHNFVNRIRRRVVRLPDFLTY